METNEHPEPNTAKAATEPPVKPSPTVVGIGASAGGLAALKAFFAHVPEGSGLAFVVVVHLSPEHESHLAEILQPHVPMPVEQVTKTTKVEPNRVYVIPPNANLSAVDTHLRLSDLEESRRARAPIDHFLRTLAKTHDGHSAAVILSGTGSDGTLGIRETKQAGGLTVVQDPSEAEYDGMPQSAIASGMVDLVLPLAEIPAALLRFARTEPRVAAPEDGEDAEAEERRLLYKTFAQIRARTGRDFTHYKRSTVLRRIARRMQIRRVEEMEAYLELLRAHPEEVRDLADDLLITVTNFFRDPEVFQALETEVVPQLFEGKAPGESVRVWSVGCATGEEAYSLAILLLEEAARREARGEDPPPHLQVFASDLHDQSLQKARDGFYVGDIEADVSAERLRRFFHKDDGGYRVKKEVRDLVVFAPHNLLGDPPFSRLDLIACRNVLIYLKREVQQAVVELFHYALNPGGLLILGTSETVEGTDLFQVEDKKRCVFLKRNVHASEPRLPVFPLARRRLPGDSARAEPFAEHAGEPLAYGALHQRMVERYAPPSLLVSPDDKVVHISEHAGRYLAIPGGELTANVYKLVREELRIELRTALHAARQQREAVRTKPVTVRLGDNTGRVVLDVRPAPGADAEGFTLVIFDERGEEPAAASSEARTRGRTAPEAREEEDEAEFTLARQRLQAVIEEYETSQEELRASNEELQSANEELRSTMEELETSKEELQSMNEELQAVNQENRHKVEELAQVASDLQNLLASTDIATLFLDRDLRILRFTPTVGALFNVRPADRGRPLSDLTHRLSDGEIVGDARRVLETLVPVEREVADEAGRWYLMRALPYRSVEDRIEGVVVTFVDITARKQAEEEVHKARVYAESIVETLHEPLLVLHPDLRIRTANQAFYDHFEVPEAETLDRRVYDLGNGQWDIPELRTLLEEVLPDSEVFNDYEVTHEFEAIGRRVMLLNARRLDHVQLILLGIRDITDRKQAEAALRESAERQAFLLKLTDALRPLADPVEVQAEAARVLGEHLGAGRAYYVEIDEANGEFIVARDWHRPGVPSHARRYPLGDWPMPWLINGETWVVRDVDTDPAMPDEQRAAYRGNDIGSCVVVPLVKEGRLVATFAVNKPEPRAWTDAEVARVEETAERTWAAVEQAKAEEKRRAAKERYLALYNAIDQGFCTIEVAYDEDDRPLDYRFLEVSPSFERQTGIENAAGRWMRDIAEDQDEVWFERYGRVAKDRRPERFEAASTPLARWWTVYAFPIGEPHERRIAVLFSDITKQKEAEAALRASEERFRAVAELVPDLLWRSRPDGYTTWYNRRWLAYTGQTADEAEGWGWTNAIHPDDRARSEASYRQAAETGKLMQQEHRIRRHDGAYRWFLVRAEPVRDDEGRVQQWLGAATDVHEQRTAMETLEVRVAERTRQVRGLAHRLTMAEQEERRRISQILHDDLQQILYGVGMKMAMIRQGLQQTEHERLSNDLDQARAWVDQAVTTTRQLAVDLSPPILQKEGLTDALQWLERQMMELHGLDVTVEAAHPFHIEDEDLRVLLFQIVRELLFNVKKHAGTDRATVRLADAEGPEEARRLVIHVIDEGRGFVAESVAAREEAGGFGLYNIQERLRLLGGHLEVRSRPGEGTQVEVHAPAT